MNSAQESAKKQLDNLIEWLRLNEYRLSEYTHIAKYDHEVLDRVKVIEALTLKIKEGNLNAIQIGCDFVTADFRTPFGKIIKCNLYNGLRRQLQYIDEARRLALVDLAVKCINLPHPPREAKALMKMIKHLGGDYVRRVIDCSHPVSEVGAKHFGYLQNCLTT